jgi:hypothetical protein
VNAQSNDDVDNILADVGGGAGGTDSQGTQTP